MVCSSGLWALVGFIPASKSWADSPGDDSGGDTRWKLFAGLKGWHVQIHQKCFCLDDQEGISPKAWLKDGCQTEIMFPFKLGKGKWMNAHFHPLLLCKYDELVGVSEINSSSWCRTAENEDKNRWCMKPVKPQWKWKTIWNTSRNVIFV